jgi:hypothetical protein
MPCLYLHSLARLVVRLPRNGIGLLMSAGFRSCCGQP